MKPVGILFIVGLNMSTYFAQNQPEKRADLNHNLLFCGMQYDQDTTKQMKQHPDSLKVENQKVSVKQSKKNLPVKEAKQEPKKRND